MEVLNIEDEVQEQETKNYMLQILKQYGGRTTKGEIETIKMDSFSSTIQHIAAHRKEVIQILE